MNGVWIGSGITEIVLSIVIWFLARTPIEAALEKFPEHINIYSVIRVFDLINWLSALLIIMGIIDIAWGIGRELHDRAKLVIPPPPQS